METYITLLRGINVGGKNKIPMADLRQTFERIGMVDVTTYINTGNVIYRTDFSAEEQERLIHDAIERDFGIDIRVLVKSKEEFRRIADSVPSDWTNDKATKSEVMFLWEDKGNVLAELPIREGVDIVKYVPGAILWSLDRTKLGRSGLKKLISRKIYRQMTIRNVNTTRKLMEMLNRK